MTRRSNPRRLAVALVLTAGLLTSCAHWETRAPSGFPRQEVAFSYSAATERFYLAAGKSTVHESYDPATDTWSVVAAMPESLDHVAAVDVGGLIYYVGGLVTFPSPAVGSVHIYDPVADTFSIGEPMPAGRERGAGGVAVHDGRIYYAGGLHGGAAVDWFDVYDPTTDTWTVLPDMPDRRDHFGGAVVADRFHVVGGRRSLPNATTQAHNAFDFSTNEWVTGLAPIPTPRGGTATAVVGSVILVIGGEGDGHTFAAVEGYDTITDTWRAFPSMAVPRHGIQAAVCGGDVFVAAGGTTQGGSDPSTAHEVFSLSPSVSCGPTS